MLPIWFLEMATLCKTNEKKSNNLIRINDIINLILILNAQSVRENLSHKLFLDNSNYLTYHTKLAYKVNTVFIFQYFRLLLVKIVCVKISKNLHKPDSRKQYEKVYFCA